MIFPARILLLASCIATALAAPLPQDGGPLNSLDKVPHADGGEANASPTTGVSISGRPLPVIRDLEVEDGATVHDDDNDLQTGSL